MYQIILESAQPEIRKTMEVILQALATRGPVLIFCMAGKDRTGIISALVLAVAGCSDEQVIKDYIRSGAEVEIASRENS